MLARRMIVPTPTRAALEQAMDRFAAGDDGALGQVYDLAAPSVMTFLMGLTRDRQLAEDLTQETFLRIHRARGLFRPGAPVLPWAYTIARRLFLDDLRTRRAGRLVSSATGPAARDADDAPALDLPAGGPTAEELFADKELSQVLDQALQKLPESQASAFRLLKGEGLSVAEVAAIMGTTKGAVKLRAHRAYEALRGFLRPELRGRATGEQGLPAGDPLEAEMKGSTR
jgi:RNA polymerase sigma-70 factor (ECF subfamily)